MTMRRIIATAGALVVALAAVPRVQLHAQLEELRQDSRFIFDAASSNLLEIRLGQMAQSKASNASVKQFGQQMVTDHSNLENQLTASMSTHNAKFQPGMNKDHKAEADRLEKLSGAEFDRQYMTSMISHHQQDVAAYQSATVRSAEARQIVTAGLPVLQQHLNMAMQVGGQVGATGGVMVATQPGTVPPPVTTQYPQGNPSDINPDMGFVRQAGSSNLMQIRLGQVAQSRATNSAVRQFGQRVVSDRTRLQQQLTSVVSSSGVSYNPTLDSWHEREVNRLQNLSGAEFDRAYMQAMIQAHQNDVSQFQAESQSGRSVQIRNLASTSLPTLQQDLSLAVQVGNQVGADSTNVAGPNPPVGGNRGDARADAEFIRDVSADNTMQVKLAELAQKKAKNSTVRQFAERVAADHRRLQEEWIAMGARNGVPVKSGMGPRHREKINDLEKENGKNFDKAYITLMIQQHQDEVSYWQKEGRASQSPQVRQLVNSGLPTLEQHLAQAKQIARQVGVNPNDALRNRTDIERDREKDKDKDKDKNHD